MNYSILRGADTQWGKAAAAQLAGQKRHLILLGKEEIHLKELSRDIQSKYSVHVHHYVVDESLTSSIVTICDHINLNFEVDLLINYKEITSNRQFADYNIQELDKKLKTEFISGILFTHQLLPNLMLHANARVLEYAVTALPEENTVSFGSLTSYIHGQAQQPGLFTDTSILQVLFPL